MGVTTEWTLTLAVAGFIAALGAFLDKYHIPIPAKEKARLALVRGFSFLDSFPIPDIARQVMIVVLRPHRRLGWWYATALAVANFLVACLCLPFLLGAGPFGWFMLEMMIVGSMIIVGFENGNILDSAVDAALLLGWFVLYLVVVPGIVFVVLRWLFRALYNSKWALIRHGSPLSAVAIVIVVLTAAYAYLYMLLSSRTHVTLGSFALFASAMTPMATLTALVLFGFLTKLVLDVWKWATLVAFEAASDPAASPFAYASGLISLLVVGGKTALDLI
jgi:hypothetical protein